MPHQGSQPNPLTGQPVMGADYTKTPPQLRVLSVDSAGVVQINSGATGGNAAAGLTGAPVPTSADFIGYFNSDGKLIGVSAINPLPCGAFALNPSGGQSEVQVNCNNSLFVDDTGTSPTYRSVHRAFTPLADAVKPFFVLQGSDTKTVNLRHMKISWACTTGNSAPAVIYLMRYTAISGGTCTAGNMVPDDTLDPPATAACCEYTDLPTTATSTGACASEYMQWVTNAAGIVSSLPISWDFGVNGCQTITLRGSSQYIGLGITAVAAGAPTMTLRTTWTEC